MKNKNLLTFCLLFLLALFIAAQMLCDSAARTLAIHGHVVELEVARTETARQRGLSYRPGLASNRGMLFVFDTPGEYCFWMKDMRFSLDIIWLSAQKRVTDIRENVSPATYPRSFCPATPSQYVIEMNSGIVQHLRITAGAQLSF